MNKKIIAWIVLVFTFLIQIGFAEKLSTLSEIRMECENQSVLVNHPFYPDSVWNSWINQGQMDLAAYNVIEKFDTIYWISGTMIYSCNSDFIGIIALFPLHPEGKQPLDFIPSKDVMKQGMTSTRPRQFWQTGKGTSAKLGFYPPPTVIDTLLLIYGAEPEYLDNDTSTTDIPYSYRTLIIDYVVYRAFLRQSKRVISDNYFDIYMKNLTLKLQADQKIFDILILPQKIQK